MFFSVLGSGSKGNSFFLSTDRVKLLIDAGLSCKELERRLTLIGIDPEDLDAIIITHEHSDHTKGAGPMARRFELPLYLNYDTYKSGKKKFGKLPQPIIIETGQSIEIGDVLVETITKCHDAADPIGLILSNNNIRVGLATDLGRTTRLLEDRLRGCHVLVLEFNYDPDMLKDGPYPLFLKRRIMGNDGHLSNLQAGMLLDTIATKDLKHLILAHLSETNNKPEKAYAQAVEVMKKKGLNKSRILIGSQYEPSPLIKI